MVETAAGLVVMARLVGFSVGLAGLTSWALRRYDALRRDVELPPLTDPDYARAVTETARDLGTSALAETFKEEVTAYAIAVSLARRSGSAVRQGAAKFRQSGKGKQKALPSPPPLLESDAHLEPLPDPASVDAGDDAPESESEPDPTAPAKEPAE